MDLPTTPCIEGERLSRRLGFVTGEAIPGAHCFKDLFAGICGLDHEVPGQANGMPIVPAKGTAVFVE